VGVKLTGDVFFRKQAWCWLEGETHRTRQKELARGDKHQRHSYTKIVSAVDDMKLQDHPNDSINNNEKDWYLETAVVSLVDLSLGCNNGG